MATQITKNFTYEELYKSSTATKYNIDNTPTKKAKEYLYALTEKVLQPIRDEWGAPIIISSGYRSLALNSVVKGASNSLHIDGMAVDFSAKDKKQNGELFKLIVSLMKLGKINLRTLIWEYGDSKNPQWIHLDINGEGHTYRKNKIITIK